jgi:hypothetical protein
LYFLYVEKKIERKITFDASKTAGRPNCSAVPCERQHKEKKKKTNITMSRHRKKIPLFLSSFLFDAIYRSNSMIGLMMSKKIDESGCDDKQEKKMESSSPVENDTFQTCRARAPHLFDLSIVVVHVLRRYRHFLSALHRIAATSIGSQHQQNKPIDENYCTCPLSFSHHLSLFQVFRYLKSTQFQRTREQTK